MLHTSNLVLVLHYRLSERLYSVCVLPTRWPTAVLLQIEEASDQSHLFGRMNHAKDPRTKQFWIIIPFNYYKPSSKFRFPLSEVVAS